MPSETRYFRNDSGSTVNGQLGRNLGITQTASSNAFTEVKGGSVTVQWGIRVWKRTSGGVETEITVGTPVAIVSRAVNGGGIQSATWDCPLTTLNATDNIVVRIYVKMGADAWKEPTIRTEYPLKYPFHTEQLGASQLDAATWTVYYYTARTWDDLENQTYADFWFGTSTYNSRIENFTWSSGAPPPTARGVLMDGFVLIS